MPVCPSCASEVEPRFRYCPWCATPVRRKIVEFFPARPFPGEAGKALRVSRYFGDADVPGHVRFSVWNETGMAEAVLSLDDDNAARLADFVRNSAPVHHESLGLRSFLQRFARPPEHRSRPPAHCGASDSQESPTERL
jgi:hypothetical protein